MGNQVVTIHPGGGISGLQRKRGRGLDLRQFGHAKIERVSEIIWYEPLQCWRVNVLDLDACRWMARACSMRYPSPGISLNRYHWVAAVADEDPDGTATDTARAVPLKFHDYDDAVAAEVAFLDALRIRGVLGPPI